MLKLLKHLLVSGIHLFPRLAKARDSRVVQASQNLKEESMREILAWDILLLLLPPSESDSCSYSDSSLPRQ